MRLPNMKVPCPDCPFRKDSSKGWLGSARMTEILEADSFVCHKNNDMQCAGHMLVSGETNAFVQLAAKLHIPLKLSGTEQVFTDKLACIEHHKN